MGTVSSRSIWVDGSGNKARGNISVNASAMPAPPYRQRTIAHRGPHSKVVVARVLNVA